MELLQAQGHGGFHIIYTPPGSFFCTFFFSHQEIMTACFQQLETKINHCHLLAKQRHESRVFSGHLRGEFGDFL